MQNELKGLSSSAAQVNCKIGLMLYKVLCSQQANLISRYGGVDINSQAFIDDEYKVGCLEKLGYFIGMDNLLSTWLDKGSDFHVSDVMDACNALNRLSTEDFKQSAGYVLGNLHDGLTKLGESTQAQTQHLTDILYSLEDLELNNIDDFNTEINILIDDGSWESPASVM